jgi:hypothetical protein
MANPEPKLPPDDPPPRDPYPSPPVPIPPGPNPEEPDPDVIDPPLEPLRAGDAPAWAPFPDVKLKILVATVTDRQETSSLGYRRSLLGERSTALHVFRD